jgi:hypothetical protein
MSSLRNIALTVHELEVGEFYWVLMEAAEQVVDDEVLPYLPLDAAAEPHESYANALVAGMAALRRRFGKDGPRA